jgi:hypothetical protein
LFNFQYFKHFNKFSITNKHLHNISTISL